MRAKCKSFKVDQASLARRDLTSDDLIEAAMLPPRAAE
jgi:hypothetical protein